MSFSISGAVDVVRWRAIVLLAMLWFPVSSSEDSTIRVEAMLSCSLLDCSLLGVLPGSSLLECSSSESCGSVSESESDLFGARGLSIFLIYGAHQRMIVKTKRQE